MNMNRKDMITDLRGMGYNYKFYKYNDKQIFRMHQKAINKLNKERAVNKPVDSKLHYGKLKNTNTSGKKNKVTLPDWYDQYEKEFYEKLERKDAEMKAKVAAMTDKEKEDLYNYFK